MRAPPAPAGAWSPATVLSDAIPALPAIIPSAWRKPAASSSSFPGVRIVTTSGLPSTRISSGSSTTMVSRSTRSPRRRTVTVLRASKSAASEVTQRS